MQKTKDYSELELTDSFIFSKVMSDVFGKGRYVYTFRNICVDDPSIELGDDATRIFLNPYGSGEISEELSEFFGYLREHKPTGEFTKALDNSVATARVQTIVDVAGKYAPDYDVEKIVVGTELKPKLPRVVFTSSQLMLKSFHLKTSSNTLKSR